MEHKQKLAIAIFAFVVSGLICAGVALFLFSMILIHHIIPARHDTAVLFILIAIITAVFSLGCAIEPFIEFYKLRLEEAAAPKIRILTLPNNVVTYQLPGDSELVPWIEQKISDILRSNPTADLTEYQEHLGIEILKQDPAPGFKPASSSSQGDLYLGTLKKP